MEKSLSPAMATAPFGGPVWRGCSPNAIGRVNVIGLATQFSVEHTTRDAADIGYRVRLFADCCASGDVEAHRASLRTLRLLAEVVSSEVAFSE